MASEPTSRLRAVPVSLKYRRSPVLRMSMPFQVAFLDAAIGGLELVVVLFVALIVFGPQQLPRIARMIGRVVQQLRSASSEFHDQIMDIQSDIEMDTTDKSNRSSPEQRSEKDATESSGNPNLDPEDEGLERGLADDLAG